MNRFPPTQAILLAAGFGTRLKPVTNRIPKPALPVGGVPILAFNLALLQHYGVRDCVITLHHFPEKIKNAVAKLQWKNLNIRYSVEKKILGTAGGVAQAFDLLDGRQTTLVLNGDIVHDINLGELFQLHRRTRSAATLACVSPKNLSVKSLVHYGASGGITTIGAGKSRRQGVFSGAQAFEPELLRDFPRGTYGCLVQDLYRPRLTEGARLQAYEHSGAWWDVGSFRAWQQADASLWRRDVPPTLRRLWREASDSFRDFE